MAIRTAEIGRVKKMETSPWEMVSDWRSVRSTIGPRTRASTTGAAGNFSLRIR